jgi:hypothetical protein
MCSWKKSLRIEKPRSPGSVGGAHRPLCLGDNWNGTRGPPHIYALLATGNQSDEYCKPRSEDTREIGKRRVDYGPPGSSNDCHPSKHGRDLLLAPDQVVRPVQFRKLCAFATSVRHSPRFDSAITSF